MTWHLERSLILNHSSIAKNPHFKDHLTHGLRAAQLHFDAVGIPGKDHQEVPGERVSL